MKVKRYEELVAWQRAMELTKRVYALQKNLPKEEVYSVYQGLCPPTTIP